MIQKIIKVGNSLATTVPKSLADQLNIKSGTPVAWEKTGKGLLLYIPEKVDKSPQSVDPEVLKLIDKISKKYSKAWQELAKL